MPHWIEETEHHPGYTISRFRKETNMSKSYRDLRHILEQLIIAYEQAKREITTHPNFKLGHMREDRDAILIILAHLDRAQTAALNLEGD
jgi:hypothetical protein